MKVIVSNYFWLPVKNLDPLDFYRLKEDLVIVPKSNLNYGEPRPPARLFKLAESNGEQFIGVPRGYFKNKWPKRMIGKYQFDYDMKVSSGDYLSNLSNNIILRPEDQEPDVTKFLIELENQVERYGCAEGMFCAWTSYGKSFSSLEMIRRLRLRTILIVHQVALLKQWEESTKKVWPDLKIGVVQGSKFSYQDKDIVFASLQTLMGEKQRFVKDFFNYFGVVLVDECLHPDTIISIPSGLCKISEIEVGDEVLTPSGIARVKDKWVSKREAIEITFVSGRKLICSRNHLLASRVTNARHMCLAESKREIKKAEDCKYVELFNLTYFDFSSKRADFLLYRMIGWVLADGCVDGGIIKFGFRKVEKCIQLRKLFDDLEISFKETQNSRGDYVFSSSHLFRKVFESFPEILKKKAMNVFVPEKIYRFCSLEFLAGYFDCDSSFNCDRVELNSVSEKIMYQISDMLSAIGIHHTVRKFKKNKNKHNDIVRICIFKDSLKKFRDLIGYTVESKKNNLNNYLNNKTKNTYNIWEKVVSVRSVGEIDLVDIELDDQDRLFGANGYLSHNCHRFGGNVFGTVIPKFNAKYVIGVTATPRRADGMEDVFFYHSGPVLVTASEINRPVPNVFVKQTGFRSMKQINNLEKPTLLNILAGNEDRNKMIARDCVKAIKTGRRPLVMSERMSMLQGISKYVDEISKSENLSVSNGFYIGGKSKEELDFAASCDIVFATIQLAKEGIDIPRLDTLLLCSSVSDVEQIVGRILRRHPDKKQPMVVDYVDSNITKFVSSFKSRLRLYRRLKWPTQGWGVNL